MRAPAWCFGSRRVGKEVSAVSTRFLRESRPPLERRVAWRRRRARSRRRAQISRRRGRTSTSDSDDDPLRGKRHNHERDEPLRVLLEGENGEVLRQRHVLHERVMLSTQPCKLTPSVRFTPCKPSAREVRLSSQVSPWMLCAPVAVVRDVCDRFDDRIRHGIHHRLHHGLHRHGLSISISKDVVGSSSTAPKFSMSESHEGPLAARRDASRRP